MEKESKDDEEENKMVADARKRYEEIMDGEKEDGEKEVELHQTLISAVYLAREKYYEVLHEAGYEGAYFPLCIKAITVGDDFRTPSGLQITFDDITQYDKGDEKN